MYMHVCMCVLSNRISKSSIWAPHTPSTPAQLPEPMSKPIYPPPPVGRRYGTGRLCFIWKRRTEPSSPSPLATSKNVFPAQAC